MPVSDRPSFPFRFKLSLAGMVLGAVPLVIAGLLLLDVIRSEVERSVRDFHLAVADDVARTVEAELSAARDGLHAAAEVLLNADLPPDATAPILTAVLGGNEHIDHLGIYDARGNMIDSVMQQGLQLSLPARLTDPALEHQDREAGVLATKPTASGPRLPMVLALRVRDTVTGYVYSEVSLAPVQQRVERLSELRFQRRLDSPFVVDEQQRLIAHPDGSRAIALQSIAGEGILDGVEPRVVTSQLNITGEYEGTDEPMIGSLIGLDEVGWAVVTQTPQATAYKSVHDMRRLVIGSLALVVLLSMFVAVIWARRITRPIESLTEFASDLAKRRFDKRVTIETSDELSILGSAMSAAAQDLEESDKRIREEVAIRSDLGRYLPEQLVDKVVKREQDMNLGGERREISVLFADVVAFTPLAKDHSAEEVVALLNELFTILTEIVFRHEGTIDKFVGDCVMAIWGAPSAQPDHAARAVRAAEDMMRWLEAGNAGWKEKYGVTIELAIGVHSGEAIVGNIGSTTRMEYTAIGDTVNVAARLESIARPGQILLTAATQGAAPDEADYVDRGEREFSGRPEPVHLFEVRL